MHNRDNSLHVVVPVVPVVPMNYTVDSFERGSVSENRVFSETETFPRTHPRFIELGCVEAKYRNHRNAVTRYLLST